MQYDAFISYSRKDVDWAVRLEQGLKARGLQVFRDEERLKAGEEWESQLQGAISESRHLLVLWSDHARESDWVYEERSWFDSDIKGSTEKRGATFINLQGKFKAAGRYHQVDYINQAGVYGNGIKAIDADPKLWLKVLDKVEEAVKADDSLPIVKVPLVSTLTSLQNLPLTAKAGFAPKYGETLEAIRIKRDDTDAWKTELAKYYSDDRANWRPFGAGSTIDQLLADVRAKILAVKQAPKFRWREVDEEFWADEADPFETAVGNIAQHLAFLVIDPLSLYDPDVANRLPTLRAMLQPQRCATVFLAPFAIPPESSHLRRVVKGAALDLFKQYYDPPFNGSTIYSLSVCAHDDLDLKRVLSTGLDRQLLQDPQRVTSNLPRVGI
jgi:hypothetical protein